MSMCSSDATCCASSRPKPPTNTPSRRNTFCSSGLSSAWLQSSVARRVRWREGASRTPFFSDVQALGEVLPHALHAQERHARGGEFQRQRQAVELAADVHHRVQVAFVEAEARLDRADAGDEQRHRAVRRRIRQHGMVRHRQGAEPDRPLARQLQGLLARDQDLQVGHGVEQLAHERGHRIDEVLAVVQNQQFAAAQAFGQFDARVGPPRQVDAQRQRHGARQCGRVRDGGQFDHPGAVPEIVRHLAGHGAGQAGLADAARPQQAEQAMLPQQVAQHRLFGVAAQQGGQQGGQVAGVRAQGPGGGRGGSARGIAGRRTGRARLRPTGPPRAARRVRRRSGSRDPGS